MAELLQEEGSTRVALILSCQELAYVLSVLDQTTVDGAMHDPVWVACYNEFRDRHRFIEDHVENVKDREGGGLIVTMKEEWNDG